MELRCQNTLHGRLEDFVLEVKCHSKRCGAGNGAVVFHYFSLENGEMIDTKFYSDPQFFFEKGNK